MFKDRFTPERLRPIVEAFEEGAVVHAGEDVASADYVELARAQPALGGRCELTGGDESPAAASAPSSSCSRACTSRSASTRTPSAPAPPTGPRA